MTINGLTLKTTPLSTDRIELGDGQSAALSALPVSTPTTSAIAAAKADCVQLTGNQTVAGIKTFSSSPVVPTAATGTNNTQAASTAFVQLSLAAGGATSRSLVVEVRNQSGATMTAGTVVYINGATGNLPTIAKALGTGDATSAQTIGLVQTSIANNGTGLVVIRGIVSNLNTQSLTEGQQLYLSATVAGAYTTTKQYAPNHLVYIGIVTRSHPTLGSIEVAIQNGYELDEIHDVSAQNPTNGDTLRYNSTTGLWEKSNALTAEIARATAAEAALVEQIKSSTFSAVVGGRYAAIATLTANDPTTRADGSALQNGDSYSILVNSGATTTSRGTYSVADTMIRVNRVSGAWVDSPIYASVFKERYSAGGYGLRKTHTKLAQMGAGIAQLKLISFGDSMAGFGGTGFPAELSRLLERAYGALGTGPGQTATLANGATQAVADYTYWPTGGYFSVPTSGTVTYGRGGAGARCDTIKVYYVKEAGAGTFKVQSSSDGGSSWSDEAGYTSVSAADATTQLGIITISKTYGTYMIRVVGLSGTVKFLESGLGQFVTTSGSSGVQCASIAIGGLGLPNANSSNASILSAWLADYAPDLGFYEMKESSAVYSAGALTTFQSRMNAGAPLMDWVFILTTPNSTNDADLRLENEYVRAHASANGYAWLDFYGLYRSWSSANSLGLMGDGVHRTTLGNQMLVGYTIDHLALDRGPGGVIHNSAVAPVLGTSSLYVTNTLDPARPSTLRAFAISTSADLDATIKTQRDLTLAPGAGRTLTIAGGTALNGFVTGSGLFTISSGGTHVFGNTANNNALRVSRITTNPSYIEIDAHSNNPRVDCNAALGFSFNNSVNVASLSATGELTLNGGATIGGINGTAISRFRHGTATLVSGTATVADTSITANSRIFINRFTDGGTLGASYSITRTASTSFTVTAKDGTGANQTADTSTVAYEIIEP